MARSAGPKLVQCYLCGHRFEVGAMTQSTSCPGCNKPVIVADEVIKKVRGPIRELKTCGRITVHKKARLMAEHIVAHAGIENLGIIEAKHVLTGGGLHLGPKAEFKGELHSQWVVMDEGAKVKPSVFHVPSDPKGLQTTDGEGIGPGDDSSAKPPGPGDTVRGSEPPTAKPMKTTSTRNLPRPPLTGPPKPPASEPPAPPAESETGDPPPPRPMKTTSTRNLPKPGLPPKPETPKKKTAKKSIKKTTRKKASKKKPKGKDDNP